MDLKILEIELSLLRDKIKLLFSPLLEVEAELTALLDVLTLIRSRCQKYCDQRTAEYNPASYKLDSLLTHMLWDLEPLVEAIASIKQIVRKETDATTYKQ